MEAFIMYNMNLGSLMELSKITFALEINIERKNLIEF